MKVTKASTIFAAVAALTMANGCGANHEIDNNPEGMTPPAGTVTLTESTELRAVGRFERDNVAIRFTLSKEGESRRAVVTQEDGTPLIDAVVQVGFETTVVLGGRATVSGLISSETPTVEGDKSALDSLFAMPEAKLIGSLRETLEAYDVDPVLLRANTDAGDPASRLWYNGYYWTLYPRDWIQFSTWAFWRWTTIQVQNGPTRSCLSLQAGLADSEVWTLAPNMQTMFRRQWWGVPVTVRNCNDYSSGGWINARSF